MKYEHGIVALMSLVVMACGGTASTGTTNSETHFLGYCTEGSCDDGLSCVCGVCTVTCDPASTCADLNADASCQSGDAYAEACGEATRPSVCDVTCSSSEDCSSLGSEYNCSDGFCRLAGCLYAGNGYQVGDEFPAEGSSCNTCVCDEAGAVVCTRLACDVCEYAGSSYMPGDSFPSEDGCNQCGCEAGGNVVCTERACQNPECTFAGESYAVGDTFPADCGNCSCVSAGQVECSNDCNNYCLYEGNYYGDGDSFPASDGCNTCTCSAAEGAVACTQIGCDPSCTAADGTQHPVGASMPADDGCNTCTCTSDAMWACTDMACSQTCEYGGQTYQDGDVFEAGDGCNSCTCMSGTVGCTLVECNPECSLPFEVGECDAAIPVYWFDSASGACEPRTYGGCGGNSNNFASVEACQAACL